MEGLQAAFTPEADIDSDAESVIMIARADETKTKRKVARKGFFVIAQSSSRLPPPEKIDLTLEDDDETDEEDWRVVKKPRLQGVQLPTMGTF